MDKTVKKHEMTEVEKPFSSDVGLNRNLCRCDDEREKGGKRV